MTEEVVELKGHEVTVAANTSNYVYIRSEEYAWVPGRLLERDGTQAIVSVPVFKNEEEVQSDGGRIKRHEKVTVDLATYPNSALLLQNVDEHGNLNEVEDMVDLPFLHEAAILYNLKTRHQQQKPYTRTGDIVIACNPYQWFERLYNEETRVHYSRSLVWDPPDGDPRQGLEPHIYEASALAYRGLAVDGEDQSILVSGESGAGKTESVKICLNHIASVQQGHAHGSDDVDFESPIVQRVLDSNPLLEAFGNAKTVRNDNSSRFGKYIRLQFDAEDPVDAAYAGRSVPSCRLAGSKCEVYLLEKSRVVTHEEEERTYHIFYQLLAAEEDVKTKIWGGLADTDNESFSYVGFTDTDTIEGNSDAERFQHTIDSLALIGIKDEKLMNLMRAICIVLQLGNLIFEKDEKDDTHTAITSEDEFTALAELMDIPKDELLPALTIRTMRARNEEFKVPLNEVQSKDSCDAFAKEIYAKTFLWLVRAINDATCAELNYDGKKKANFAVIGLLDIFGFESFTTNRFEQLCINYANEKLQQKFTQDIFRSVQAEYETEGIELEEITYDDNTDVLDLVEGRMGLLAVLNEECVRPGGSDRGFVSKVQAMNKESPCFLREKQFEECVFGVRHFAGRVIYDANGFVTKNMDTLPSDLQDCAKKSSNMILVHELSNEAMMNSLEVKTKKPRKSSPKVKKPPPAKRGSNLVGDTVWTKFKSQLTSLMTNLTKTRTRYIRCIKPNPLKAPLVMQHVSTIEQLRCAGVVAAVTISRSAFPNRLEHEAVLYRFKSLWGKGEQHLADLKVLDIDDPDLKSRTLVDRLLGSALKDLQNQINDETLVKAFVIGNTRAYFRAGALEHLEAERVKKLGVWVVEIQKIARKYMVRARYGKMRFCTIALQSFARKRHARRTFTILRNASILLTCWYRCIRAKRKLAKLSRDQKASMIQTHWRMAIAITELKRCRKAAAVIQSIARGALQRPKYRVAIHEKREEAKLENQVVALQRKLEEAEARRVEAERMAEEKARKAIQEFREANVEEKKEGEESGRVEDDREANMSVAPSLATLSVKHDVNDEDVGPSAGQLSAQQQTLMDESGKMLEYLRKEVFKLRSQNAQMRTDFDLLKDNNQRLMDANASAGASFAALNQHAKHLTRTNDKISTDLLSFKQQVQKLSVTQVELKEELKMKQATYTAEVHSRLQFQKALSKIVDIAQERCRDSRLVEDILRIADECESDYMSGPTGIDRPNALFSSPSSKNGTDSAGLISSLRSFWS
uniref:Myosin G n=1 Tax=Phaeodactylum tricornutum TaxID=2850 RepID=C6JVY9_PHATR|nr:myosin G [Phaeodactylum tricornutum]